MSCDLPALGASRRQADATSTTPVVELVLSKRNTSGFVAYARPTQLEGLIDRATASLGGRRVSVDKIFAVSSRRLRAATI